MKKKEAKLGKVDETRKQAPSHVNGDQSFNPS
jgi:hypothetical protein